MWKLSRLATLMLLLGMNSNKTQAELLDKILAIYDDQIITASEVNRVKNTIPGRKQIAPQIYSGTSFTPESIVKLKLRVLLIRDKLEELGYIINDDQVESQINDTEKRLGLTRPSLLAFLKSNNTTFSEYFELTRESIEFNIFNSRVVRPLITITEQEIKNRFYKENLNNKTLTFRYNLVDFFISTKEVKKSELPYFMKALHEFKEGGSLPDRYRNVETSQLGDITEDGLAKNMKNVLKQTEEGSFSKPIVSNGFYHIFFVKKKDITESEIFLQSKERIYSLLYQETSLSVTNIWFEREENNHYIKYFL